MQIDKETKTALQDVTCAVPQESVLGHSYFQCILMTFNILQIF